MIAEFEDRYLTVITTMPLQVTHIYLGYFQKEQFPELRLRFNRSPFLHYVQKFNHIQKELLLTLFDTKFHCMMSCTNGWNDE